MLYMILNKYEKVQKTKLDNGNNVNANVVVGGSRNIEINVRTGHCKVPHAGRITLSMEKELKK